MSETATFHLSSHSEVRTGEVNDIQLHVPESHNAAYTVPIEKPGSPVSSHDEFLPRRIRRHGTRVVIAAKALAFDATV